MENKATCKQYARHKWHPGAQVPGIDASAASSKQPAPDDSRWICGECELETLPNCKGKRVPGQGAEKPEKTVKEPCLHSKECDRILNPEGEGEEVPEEVQQQINDLLELNAWAEDKDHASVVALLKVDLEKLRPETKVLTESETVKNLKIVMTDLSSLTGRHEQTMSNYDENIKGAKEKMRGFEEREAARLKQLEFCCGAF